jgi:hypothetical protein
MASIEKQRALQRSEKAKETSDLWEAILAVNDALVAAGLQPLPPTHVRRAQSNLMRAGVIGAGDLPDDVLQEIATVAGSRAWTANMGPVYQNETVFMPDGSFYICTQMHIAQAGLEPSGEGGAAMFRAIRKEPEEGGEPLDFVWGELVPFGAVRRDPVDEEYYTPAIESGVTLYEPLYPHLVPSKYAEADYIAARTSEATEEPEEAADPRWADLPDGHSFAVGDRFTDYTKTYVVIRAFEKEAQTRPPALIGDAYEQA